MRIAALDLGSNSFHLLVVETRPDGSFAALVREKEMLRLGDVVAELGFLDEDAVARAIEVVARFRAIAESHHVDEQIAYATAALREAANGPEVVDRIEFETGVPVQVVNGIREAQLVFEAVRASVLMEPSPVLCADLGGGSLELAVGDGQGIHYATSLHLGVGRLTTELVRSDPPSEKDLSRLRRRVEGQLAEVIDDVTASPLRQLIGSSGTMCALVRGTSAMRDGEVPQSVNQRSVGRGELAAFAELALSLDAEKRGKLPGIDTRRSELLPAGFVVAQCLLEMTELDLLTTSEWALREGMVVRTLARHDRAEFSEDPHDLRRASVLSLCRRSSWRQRHAESVARIALDLFDSTAQLHGAREDDRELLELAALLHDIGEHISRDGHGGHGAYLIEQGGLRGFSPDEVRVLATIVRFHTRGKPRDGSPGYDGLGEEERARVPRLLALLRIADGLDVSHSGIVGRVTASLEADRVVIAAPARGEAELETWMFHRKRALFEETFGLEAVLELHHGRHDDFAPERAEEAAGLG